MTYTAIGGLGDFLQMSRHAQEAGEIIVVTHAEYSKPFFADLGVKVIAELKFDDIPGLLAHRNIGTELQRDVYYAANWPIQLASRDRDFHDFEIVIHPFGSTFSNTVDKLQNNVGKNFPLTLVNKIARAFPNKKVALTGRLQEVIGLQTQGEFADNIVKVYPGMWTAVEMAAKARVFIGADSFLKTARCMMRSTANCYYNTIILVEAKPDPFRDKWFIAPYTKDNHFLFYRKIDEGFERTVLDAISLVNI